MRTVALAIVLIILAAFAIYAGGLGSPMIGDDLSAVVGNASIRSLWPLGPVLIPPRDTSVAGRPMVNLTFALNHALHGLDVRGYHLVNSLIHAASALWLFTIVRHTLGRTSKCADLQPASTALATAVALIWVVHPLHTETVMYINQRSELVAGFFMLSTLCCSIGVLTPTARRRWAWTLGAIASCTLGMASKEVMVAAPLIVLLYDAVFVSGSLRRALRGHGWFHALLAATWVVLILLNLEPTRPGSAGFGTHISSFDYLKTQAGVILHYLKLSIWPYPQSILYDIGVEHNPAVWLPRGLLILAIVVWSVVAVYRGSGAGFLASSFFLVLAPTSSVLPIVTEFMAERRMYLPLASVVVLIVVAVYLLLRSTLITAPRRSACAVLLAAAVVAVLGANSIVRVSHYHSEVSIWQVTVDSTPDSSLAHTFLGYALLRQEHIKAATEEARRALELRGDNLKAMRLAGHAFSRSGDYPEAIRHLKMLHLYGGAQAPDAASLLSRTYCQYALELLGSGEARDAIEQYRQTLMIDSNDPVALNALARIHATHPDPALRDGYLALALAENACKQTHQENPAPLDTLAAAHAEVGHFAIAIKIMEKVVTITESRGNAAALMAVRHRLAGYRRAIPYRLTIPQVEPNP